MPRAARIKSISYFKANAAEILQEPGEIDEPMIIIWNGEAKAIVQDVVSDEKTSAPRPPPLTAGVLDAYAKNALTAFDGVLLGRGVVTAVGAVP